MDQAVIVLVFLDQSKKKLLAIKRRDVAMWTLPGGGIDEGETPEEAAIREVLEETGVVVKVQRTVGIYTPVRFTKTLTYLIECFAVDGVPKVTDEVCDVGFFPIHNPPQLFFKLHEIWIEEALQNHPYIIERELTELNIWSFFKYALCHPIHVGRYILAKVFRIPINTK